MPEWLIIELTVGVLWFIFWVILYRVKFWKMGFSFRSNPALSILFLIFFPITWLVTLIIICTYFIIQDKSIYNTSLLIPLILFVHLLIRFIYYKKNKSAANYIEEEILKKKQECIQWLKKCNFRDEKRLNIQVYEAKNIIVSKVIVRGVTEEQYICLKNSEKFLPENTHLYILKD